jgi:hypothetical protein
MNEQQTQFDPAYIEGIAQMIAWAHWKVIYPRDASRDASHLWDNLGDRDRCAYRKAALVVAAM